MLTIHHLGISQSDRIVWLCEELDLPYELTRTDRDPATRGAPAAYRGLHPAGTAPVIEDAGVRMAESGAIVEYLLARHGGGRLQVAPDNPDFADYLFWFHYANASMMPRQFGALIAAMLPDTARDAPIFEALRLRGDGAFKLAEGRLAVAPFFGGATFTAADIMMVFPLSTMRVFAPRDMAPYPNIRGYLQRIAARPAYQRALAKADPGMTPLLT